MSFTTKDLPDLTGTRVVVTGANSGIGLAASRALAEHGAQVTLAVRNTDAGSKAAASLAGDPQVERLDLASQASIKDFAERWQGPLDLLVNNAGLMTPPRYRATEDGHELQLGTNHLGHAALTARLLPALLESPHPRVVTVSSVAHHRGDDSVLAGNPEAGYDAWRYYGNSKLANLLFALELHRRAQRSGSPLVSTACHPGVSATGLVEDPNGQGANPLVRRFSGLVLPLVLQSATAGANPTLYAATRAESGSYHGPQWLRETRGPVGQARLSRWARDEDLARRLWEWTEQQLGLTIDL